MTNQHKKRVSRFPSFHLQNDQQVQSKRPCLCSFPSGFGVGDGVLSPKSLAYVENYFRPMIREVVETKIEVHLNQFHQLYLNSRRILEETVAKDDEVVCVVGGSRKENLKLRFMKNIPSIIFTTNHIEDENGEPLQVALFDVTNNTVLDASHPLSSALIEVVVLHGDFDDEKVITRSDFDTSIVSQRLGERPFLLGDDKRFRLRNGVFSISKLSFTTNSSRTRTKNFRLGLRIIDEPNNDYPTIRYAVSNRFRVKDHRGQLNEKHHPPSGDDPVWRLEGIGRNGEYQKRLASKGILTVDCFVKAHQRDSRSLRKLLGNRVSEDKWRAMVNNALEYDPMINPTCHPSNFQQNLVQNEAMEDVEVANQSTAVSNGHGFQDQTLWGDLQEPDSPINEDYYYPTPTLLSHGEASTSNAYNNHSVESPSIWNQYFQGAAWNKLVPKPK